MKLLILSQWCDYLSTNVYHYSISKGFNIGAGFSKIITTYYMTLGKTQDYELQDNRIIHLINNEELTLEFLESLDFILFIKEVEMFSLIEKVPNLKTLCLREYNRVNDSSVSNFTKVNDSSVSNFTEVNDSSVSNFTKVNDSSVSNFRRQKIGIKSDSLGWIRSENMVCKQLFGFDCHEFALKCLDLLYVQTPEFKAADFKRFGNKDQRIYKKIFISPMGVNNYIEKIVKEDPYDMMHSYCVKNSDSKLQNHMYTALYPLPLLPLLDLPDNDEKKTNALNEFNQKKTVLIYSGRLKMNGVLDMLKNIMKELGNKYELHIFPGSFNLPASYRKEGEEDTRYSGKHSFQVLRDRVFYDSTNIIVHHPFTESDKCMYLTYADIGIDFSQSRPNNVKSCQGNCKLLEYCYYGIKVVAEKNINNSSLVENGKNGILIPNIGSVSDYVNAIKEMEKREIDHEYTKMQTIKLNNWDIIAQGVLNDFINY